MCVCVKERDRRACVPENENDRVSLRVTEEVSLSARERERGTEFVCLCERDSLCVCERESEGESSWLFSSEFVPNSTKQLKISLGFLALPCHYGEAGPPTSHLHSSSDD